jgi:hypothetical protein
MISTYLPSPLCWCIYFTESSSYCGCETTVVVTFDGAANIAPAALGAALASALSSQFSREYLVCGLKRKFFAP